MKKVLLGISIVSFLSVGIFLGYTKFGLNNASANPDYICVKNVSGMPCNVINYPASCSAWSAGGTRTCPGVMTTQVSYYLVRTDCEAGYDKVDNGGNVGGASGRNGGDYVSNSVSCTITEEDHVDPTGAVN